MLHQAFHLSSIFYLITVGQYLCKIRGSKAKMNFTICRERKRKLIKKANQSIQIYEN